MSTKIKIKYFTDIEPLEYIDGYKSNWIDLRVAESMDIAKGSFVLVPLGVAMELPKGYEAIIAPRSSTFKNYGLIQTNSIGIIDESYCGDRDEWKLPVYATKDIRIEKNDRICQFRIIKHQPEIEFEVVTQLIHDNRGGFGSTGIN